MKYSDVSLCRFNEFNLSCFGCCGHGFTSKDELVLAVRKNNFEFEDKNSLNEFMNRDSSLRECGICRNVVTLSEGTLGCPGHPKQCGEELRKCNIFFECKKSFLYKHEWNKTKKEEFHKLIKNMDDFEYSLFMGKNEDF